MKSEQTKYIAYAIQDTFSEEVVFIGQGIKAGFPSPAQEYMQETIDLNKVLISHPTSTFVIVAQRGMSKDNCINEGNLLIIDRSLKPIGNELFAYSADGELNISNTYPEKETDFIFWGTLIANIRMDPKHTFHAIESIPLLPEISREYPSFVQEYIVGSIDLNKVLIKNAPTTFITIAEGDSMIKECIDNGDLLIIDKSLYHYDGCLAVCYIDGDFTLKKVSIEKDHAWLLPANPAYQPIEVTEQNDFIIWGIVTSSIKLYRKHHDRVSG